MTGTYERSPFQEFERKPWTEEAKLTTCFDCGYANGRHASSCEKKEREANESTN